MSGRTRQSVSIVLTICRNRPPTIHQEHRMTVLDQTTRPRRCRPPCARAPWPSTRRRRTPPSCPSCSAAGSTSRGTPTTCCACASSTPPWRRSSAPTSTTRPWPPSTTPRSSGSPRSTPTSTTGCPDGDPHASTPPPPTAYRARLLEQAAEWAALLVAHHYTRYLGDLSGGQAIGRILDRTFELDGARHRVLRLPGDREAEALQGRLPRPPRRARPERRGAGPRRRRGQGRVPAQPGAVRRARQEPGAYLR